MKKITLLLCAAAFFPLLGACAIKKGHSFLEKMPEPQIASHLVKDVTTKAEAKQYFGDPEDIDHRDDGHEIWTYKFIRSSAKGANFIPIVNSVYAGTNDTTTKLKVIFNKNGTVEKHSLSHMQGQTQTGLFQ